MSINFTCPHCGRSTTRKDLNLEDVDYVDLGNGLPDAIFPVLAEGEERHLDQRICCQACYDAHGKVPKQLGQPHPFDPSTHQLRLAAIDASEAARNPSNGLARESHHMKRLGLKVET